MKRKITLSVLFVFAMIMSASFAGNVSAQTAPSLGTAANFSVLGATTVTNTGLTVVNGNLGVSPGTAVTGFAPTGPGVVTGTIFTGAGSAAGQAQIDATLAFNNLAGQACGTVLTGDLGGRTLTPGVFCFASSAQLTGTLILDAQGNPNAVFIFQIGSTLTTATGSSVSVINGGSNCNVFFQVGSSATLGTGTAFQGNILALASITLTTGASLSGRALALNGAVTLDSNNITMCAASSQSPTAATVSVSGRVVTQQGRGIRNVVVTMTDSNGNTRTATTTIFGYYRFEEVAAGETYIFAATGKRFSFGENSKVQSIMEDTNNINFVADAQSVFLTN